MPKLLTYVCGAILGALVATTAVAGVGFNPYTTIHVMQKLPHGEKCADREAMDAHLAETGWTLVDTTVGKSSGLAYSMFTKGSDVIIFTQAPGEGLSCLYSWGTVEYDEGI